MTERLKRAVMYSMALGPRFFKWKMLSLSGPNALLFLQLLIALLTRSVVNVCAISKDFLFVSLVTNRVSLKEVCLPSFDVLNCWLNLVASCLDDENEIPLKVIASFSQQNLSIFAFCVCRCASSVKPPHTTYIISSSAPTYAPRFHPWIYGQTQPSDGNG